MADQEQGNSQEPLSEREQKAIQELARAIVKVAGLARDSDEEAKEKRREQILEAGREFWKEQVDFFKHMTTLTAITAGGLTALIGAFFPNPSKLHWLFYVAFLLLGLTLLGTALGLFVASSYDAQFTAMTPPDIDHVALQADLASGKPPKVGTSPSPLADILHSHTGRFRYVSSAGYTVSLYVFFAAVGLLVF